jgi:flagellar motor switch protein FliG
MFKLVPIKSVNDETQVLNEAEEDLEIVQNVLDEEIIDETFDFDDLPF